MDMLPDILTAIEAAPRAKRRKLIAIAGAPASGKSTLADLVVNALNAKGTKAQLVPMDGFHLHNTILNTRGLLDRKGAPETFDSVGFVRLIARIAVEDEIYFPVFDRAQDCAYAGEGHVSADCDVVIVEGNYLLLDAPIWRDVAAHWDLSILLDVDHATLEQRLIARWRHHGLSAQAAKARAQGNDMRNADLVMNTALKADLTL